MKITKGQLRQIIREEVARVITEQDFEEIEKYGGLEVDEDEDSHEYVVAPQVVGTWNPENQASMRFLPNEEGKERGFKAGSQIPAGTSRVKEAPPHSI